MSDIRNLLGEDADPEKKAMFHGGFNYLDRIDKILRALDMITVPDPNGYIPQDGTLNGLSMRTHEMRLSLLQNLFKELYPKMGTKEKQEHKEASIKIKKIFYDCLKNHRQQRSKGVGLFSNYFDDWELELRDCVERKGLLMPSAKGALEAASE